MNKLLTLILTFFCISTPVNAITNNEYAELFKNYHGCFILYNLNEHKIVSEYNPDNYCNQRIAPDSTFKIALSLMAFDQGIINQNTIFKWDGQKRALSDWNQDQTPNSWMKYSAIWVSQQLSTQLGNNRIKQYLADFNYGNQDFSGDPGENNGLTYAWLSSSLKISANEQLNFLIAMLSHQLTISDAAVLNTKKIMYQGKLDRGADHYSKTGSGRHGHNERETNPSLLRDGWMVGFIDSDNQHYVFVSNLTDKTVQANINKSNGFLTPHGSQTLKPITLKILNNLL